MTELIKKYEGCEIKAYLCPAGVRTIGYGHTGPDVVAGMVISQDQADQLLINDCVNVSAQLSDAGIKLSQDKMDAVISLVFNIGIGAFQRSKLYQMLRFDHMNPKLSYEWIEFINAGGKPLVGLLRRRIDELQLYWK